MQILKKILQQIAIILQVLWAFMPGILFIGIGYAFFGFFIQGKDIVITAMNSRQSALFFLIGLFFWVLITWYTSRLIAYFFCIHCSRDSKIQMKENYSPIFVMAFG